MTKESNVVAKCIRVNLDATEVKILENLRIHYGFRTTTELVRALIKRAQLTLP